MKRPSPMEKASTYSLIYDLQQKGTPLGVMAAFKLGTVITRLDREWICLGSGEKLGGKATFKIEEIRCSVVREGDLATVRNIFKDWIRKDKKLKSGKEMALQGVLGTKDPKLPIVQTEKDDTLISLISGNEVILIRFIKENLKYIQGLNLKTPDSPPKTNVYVYGLVLQTKSKQWEIQGRALLPVAE